MSGFSGARSGMAAAMTMVAWSIVSHAAAVPLDPALQHQLMLFGDILEVAKKQYVRPPSDQQLMEGAIQGMLQQGTPGATYLTPEDYRLFIGAASATEEAAVGLQIMKDGHRIRVEGAVPNSPAETSGIEPNDVLLSIDRLTTAFTYRPSGTPLQKVGVTPDSMVAQAKADADKAMSANGFFNEVDLVNAADAEGAPARVRPTAVDSPPRGFGGDYQQARALDELKSMAKVGTAN